jgi:tRNA(Ile)-lysidine synthase
MAARAADKLRPADELVARFARQMDRLAPGDQPIGLAVSGGPDSLALLLLAAAARPGRVEAASVDHALRDGSAKEAKQVAAICAKLGVPHSTLTAQWDAKPQQAIQEKARAARYRLLANWAGERGLAALVTAHHADDQAETVLMRLARGAGIKGLAAMRLRAPVPGASLTLLRPLLPWRHQELTHICQAAGLTAADDPSNADDRFERVRMRKALAEADWIDPVAVAKSAANLAQADSALHWATTQQWERLVKRDGGGLSFPAAGIPREIQRRLARRAVLAIASEGKGADLRGPELDRLLEVLVSGRKATLRGVLCAGGEVWRFAKAPPRRVS